MYSYTSHENSARKEEEGIRNPVTRDGILFDCFWVFFTKYLIYEASIYLIHQPHNVIIIPIVQVRK